MNRLRKIQIFQLYPELTQGEAQLLTVVACRQDGITVSALAKQLDMPAPAVSRMMRGMESKGLIQRDILPRDRRNIIVTATPKGKEACNELKERFHCFFSELLKTVPSEDFDKLIENWNKLMDRMEVLLQQQTALQENSSIKEDNE